MRFLRLHYKEKEGIQVIKTWFNSRGLSLTLAKKPEKKISKKISYEKKIRKFLELIFSFWFCWFRHRKKKEKKNFSVKLNKIILFFLNDL